jgi:hypothetical protein
LARTKSYHEEFTNQAKFTSDLLMCLILFKLSRKMSHLVSCKSNRPAIFSLSTID